MAEPKLSEHYEFLETLSFGQVYGPVTIDVTQLRYLVSDMRAREIQLHQMEKKLADMQADNEKLASKHESGVAVTNYFDLGKEFGAKEDESPYEAALAYKRAAEDQIARLQAALKARGEQ